MDQQKQTQVNNSYMPSSYHQKKKFVVISICILVVLGMGALWYILHKTPKVFPKEKPISPLQKLEQLESTSAPTLIDPKRDLQDLKNLQKKSKKVTATAADRQKVFDMLNKK
jgi:hypothetical protein